MHDIKALRENPQKFDQALASRGLEAHADMCLAIDKQYRQTLTELQLLQSKRNQVSRAIGQAQKKGIHEQDSIADMKAIKGQIEALEMRQKQLDGDLKAILEQLPNIPAEDVPIGVDESANVELRKHGTIKEFDFVPKRHFELGEALAMMDFETASTISGARFVILRGALAQLERALGNFMLDVHVHEHGYEETIPPALIRSQTVYGTGQLPKFANDLFLTTDDRWLLPTAEVPLTGQAMNSHFNEQDLPKRYCAWTSCFRREAGAAGKDTRGMIRQHQFSKVEMVSITTPEQSWDELEHMTRAAEKILEYLEIAYRTITLCTGDMGFGAAKTYDIEVWLPGEDAYREISSCSNCCDFQARRMNARLKGTNRKSEYIHTLNGSGLAVGRALIAVLENYQQKDGSIQIPKVLQPYMQGKTQITL